MPPDPVLALLSFVGLAMYSVIGGTVAAVVARKFFPKKQMEALKSRQFTGCIGGYSSYETNHYAGNTWALFTIMTLLWPALFCAGVVGGVFYGPLWIATHAGSYVASIGTEVPPS